MTIFIIIFSIFIFSNILSAALESFRNSKCEEIFECVNEEIDIENIRVKELESERFKTVLIKVKQIENRKNIDLEQQLFTIINSFDNSNFTVNHQFEIDKLNELSSFMKALTSEQIKSNLYLDLTQSFLKNSVKDCADIIKTLYNKFNSNGICEIPININIKSDISNEMLELLPIRVPLQINYKDSFVELLDSENKELYIKYNEYVSTVDKLATIIYSFQMKNLLSIFSFNVKSCYFNILNNSFEHKYLSSFLIEKKKENISYELSNKMKKSISKIVGLPFDEILKMTVDELDEYVFLKYGKNLNRDLDWLRVLKNDKESDGPILSLKL